MSPRFKVLIGVPSSGVISEGTAQATYQASLHHDFDRVPSTWSGPNTNRCWKEAMNAGMRGQYTHFAIVHADIKIIEDHLFTETGKRVEVNLNGGWSEDFCREWSKLWLDVMLEDMESVGVPFLSVPAALKDSRGMLSCGIGDPDDPWTVWRRYCCDELEQLPEVFTLDDTGHPDKYLLHSPAMCLWDLRDPCWYKVGPKGDAPAVFNYSERIVWDEKDKEWKCLCQSEDWAYCRLLWRQGISSAITRNVTLHHLTGNIEFPNKGDWGTWKHGDEDLAYKWRDQKTVKRLDAPALTTAN